MIDIGTRVREWRESKSPKITQEALASAIGIAQGTLSAFEHQVHRIGEEEALKLEIFTGGEIQAEDCVRGDRRWVILEIKSNRSRAS